jgi:hypothetical protein
MGPRKESEPEEDWTETRDAAEPADNDHPGAPSTGANEDDDFFQ